MGGELLPRAPGLTENSEANLPQLFHTPSQGKNHPIPPPQGGDNFRSGEGVTRQLQSDHYPPFHFQTPPALA